MPLEEDDPVIASYDVFISQPNPSTTPNQKTQLYVLQYPSHRPNSKPYSSSRSQKPNSLRLKPNTGIIEVDVPILTSDNYNSPLGSQFGKAMHESKVNHPTTSHGLSGGFSHNQPSNTALNLPDIPSQNGFADTTLHTQTLGGKLSSSTEKDPIYMLATLKQSSHEIHLQHLDAVVQLRPQLHHIDAADELKKRAETAATRAKAAPVPGIDPSIPAKLETKAIEMKIKDTTRDDPKDRNLNLNAKLLRDIQNDPWQRYDWIEGKPKTDQQEPVPTTASGHEDPTDQIPPSSSTRQPLKSALDNDEWLNKMSSPGIELRTRLKGRDRERARRKRQERARNTRVGVEGGTTTTEAGVGGASSSTDVGTIGASASFTKEGGIPAEDLSGTESSGGSDDEATAAGVVVKNDNNNNTSTISEDRDISMEDTATTTAPAPAPAPAATEGPEFAAVVTSALARPASPEVQIKQEGSGVAVPESSTSTSTTAAPTAAVAPKRRGRPPKNKAA